MYNGNEADLKP